MTRTSRGSTHTHVIHVGHHIVHHHVVTAAVHVSRVCLLYLDTLHASLVLLVRGGVRGGHHPSHGTSRGLPGVGRPDWSWSSHGRWRSDLTEKHALRSHGSSHSGSHLLGPHAGADLVDVLLPVGARHSSLGHPGLELLVRHPASEVVGVLLQTY